MSYQSLALDLNEVETASTETITSYYETILRRSPSQEELDAWIALLGSGTTLDQVRASIIDSAEASATIDPLVRLYEAAFGRVPDDAGLAGWAAALRSGTTFLEIAQGFTGSAEFAARYPEAANGDISAFITALYQQTLGREPEAEGLQGWLNSGLPTAEILIGFSESTEFQARAETQVETYLSAVGQGSSPNTVFSLFQLGSPNAVDGNVIDGKVAGATVGIDLDGDGVIGPNEPQVTTDALGNFTFPAGTPTGTLIATGGTDISTGLPFTGQMEAPAGSTVVTPLTTMVQKLAELDTDGTKTDEQKAADAQDQLKSLLGLDGISADITQVDFVTEATEGDATGADGLSDIEATQLYAASVQVLNIVAQGAAAITGADSSVDGEAAADAVFAALANGLNNQPAGTTVDLTSTSATDNDDTNDAGDFLVGVLNDAAGNTLTGDALTNAQAITDSAAKIAASANQEVEDVVDALNQVDPLDPNFGGTTSSLVTIVQTQKVVQGEAASDLQAAAGSSDPDGAADGLADALGSSDGSGFTDDSIITDQNIGDVDGDGTDDDGQAGSDNTDDDLINPDETPVTPPADVDGSAPVFTSSQAFALDENTTQIGTITATDNASVSYSITGGLDAAAFDIDPSNGALSFNTAPDFENAADNDTNNVYEVEITATDTSGNSAVQAIEVTINNVFEVADIQAIWAELDQAYVDYSISGANNGNYTDTTLVDTAGNFSNTVSWFPDLAATFDNTGVEQGTLGYAVNFAFVQLAEAYIDWLDAGNAPILDIAKDRGSGDPGQSYHDNILGNLGDGPISSRFENATGDPDIDGDGNGDVVDDPRSVDGQEFGQRPYYDGVAGNEDDLADTIAWDVANDIATLADLDVDRNGVDPLNGKVYVLSNGSATGYNSIQAAVDAAESGDQVLIGTGTFREQVEIDGKANITITGQGDATIIEMPDTPIVTGNGNEAVITVLGAEGVTIEDVVVDGRGLGTSNGFNGIYFGDAGGTVQNSEVKGIRAPLQSDGTPQGSQIGRAIHADNNDGQARTITLDNNTIIDFQKNGIDLRGEGLTVAITNNEVEGSGFLPAQNAIAQNGIVLVFGPTGVISGNTVSEIGFGRGDWSTAGILGYDAGDGVEVTDNTIFGPVDDSSGGTIPSNFTAINFSAGEADNLVITGNIITGALDGIVLGDNVDNPTVSGNTFNDMVTSVNTDDPNGIGVETGATITYRGADNDIAVVFEGSSGNDLIEGSDFNDDLNGGLGDDTLSGDAGDDTLTGGGGEDIAVFSGARSDYTIIKTDIDTYTVTDNNAGDGDEGTNTLTGIEKIDFGDVAYDVELDANSPSFSSAPTNFSQGFETDTTGFFDDGDLAGFGFINQVVSGTNGITSATGGGHAIVEQSGAPGSERGPFTRFDGYRDTFENGFRTTIDIYLDTNWSAGEGFDYSVAANGSDGNHQRDFIFAVTQDTSEGAILIGGSNNTNFNPREDLETINHARVESSGWYTFEHVFYQKDDNTLEVAMNVYDASGDWIFTEIRNSALDTIPGEVGGNRYGWFTNVDVVGGVAIDNAELSGFTA